MLLHLPVSSSAFAAMALSFFSLFCAVILGRPSLGSKVLVATAKSLRLLTCAVVLLRLSVKSKVFAATAEPMANTTHHTRIRFQPWCLMA
jgi:hypothetical protein